MSLLNRKIMEISKPNGITDRESTEGEKETWLQIKKQSVDWRSLVIVLG